VLLAAREHFGDNYWNELNKLKSAQSLTALQQELADWKAGKPVGGDESELDPELDPELMEMVESGDALQADEGAAEGTSAPLPKALRSPQFRKADFLVGSLRETEIDYARNFR
jgi:hypothetical protein